MKCVKMSGTNELKKVEDSKAVDLVFSNKAKYVPKHEYKTAHGKGPATLASTSTKKNKKSKKNSDVI